jgi:hypothetical protein
LRGARAVRRATGRRRIGPASRPLPLYYALNQAARAIIAARQQYGQPWQPGLHGLSIGGPEQGLQGTPIRPQKSEDGGFRQLAEALDTEGLTEPTYLQNVWAAIPNLPKPGLGAGCPSPLLLEARALSVAQHVTVRRLDFIHPGAGADDWERWSELAPLRWWEFQPTSQQRTAGS